MNRKASPLRTPVLAALLATALCGPAVAQQAPAAAAAPVTASSNSKKELVARIIKLQQPGIEAMARGLAERPAAEMMDSAGVALNSRVAADKRESVARDIQADVKKYLDESVPLVQARAVRLAPTTLGAVMEEKFSEDELRQVVAIIESPAYAKFQQLGADMQKALTEKLVAEMRPTIDPKVTALEQSIAKRLGIAPNQQQGAASGSKAPAKAK